MISWTGSGSTGGKPIVKNKFHGFLGRDDVRPRTHKVIVKKNKSNLSLIFSLYGCDIPLDKISRKFKEMLVDNPEKYLPETKVIIDDWSIDRKVLSHSVTVQDIRSVPFKSRTVGVRLHDYDMDEIQDVVLSVFGAGGDAESVGRRKKKSQ